MKKLIIILMLVIGLGSITSFTSNPDPVNTEICFNKFYAGTRYYTEYNVNDKLSGGVYYYADWSWYSSHTTAYALNVHTCNLDLIRVNHYCSFRWVAY